MSIRIQLCRVLGGAALLAISSASGALAKDSGSFTFGCLTQDTALQTSEGLSSGAAAAHVSSAPAHLWPPHHKFRADGLSMSLAADSSYPLDCSVTVHA